MNIRKLVPRTLRGWFTLGCFAVLLAVLLGNVYLNNRYFVTNALEGDAASEILFAAQLAGEGRWVFSPNWYYSTELRVLHNQLVMAPLFYFISDPLLVHAIAAAMLGAMLAACTVFCLRSFLQPWWACWLAAAVTATPFSHEVFFFITTSHYYTFFVAATFVFLGLFVRLQAKPNKIVLAVLVLLAVLMGMSGVRYMLVLFLPLCITLALFVLAEKDLRRLPLKKDGPFALAGLGLAGYAVGLALNQWVLPRWLHYKNMVGEFTFSDSEAVSQKIAKLPASLLSLFAPLQAQSALSLIGLAQMGKVVFLLALAGSAVYLLVRLGRLPLALRFYVVFAWASFGVNLAVVWFMRDIYVGGTGISLRFLLIGMYPFMTLPMIALTNGILNIQKRVVGVVLVVCMLAANVPGIQYEYAKPHPIYHVAMEDSVAYLLENGYTGGFATDNNANSVRLRSGMALQVVAVDTTPDGLQWVGWLQAADNQPDMANPRQFLLARWTDYEDYAGAGYMTGDNLVYSNDYFVIFEVAPDILVP